MLNTAGLSLDQAPPISIPFRFILTAPLFGILAGVLLLLEGESLLLSRWTPQTIGLVHLLTLGFLTMVMCGAMLQMLPVIAASPVPRVVWVGGVSHLLLVVGTLLLTSSFINGVQVLLMPGVAALVLGFLLFAAAVSIALWRVSTPGDTTRGMQLAVAALVITVVFGAWVAAGYGNWIQVTDLALLTDLHLGWGMLGWVGILLVSVSLQVVPMFQVTPEYPRNLARLLTPGLFLGLLAWAGLCILLPGISTSLSLGAVLLGLVAFAAMTLRLQQQRKRRITDVTLLFWRCALLALIIGVAVWLAGQLAPNIGDSPRYPLLLGVLLILGVALPLINGMLYKIVPFLSWFHLQHRQLALMNMAVTIPHMKELVRDRAARRQFYTYLLALVSILLALFWPEWLARLAGVFLALTNLLLLINLVNAVRRYRVSMRLLGETH